MKIYVAGPMTGKHLYNHAAFMEAKEWLVSIGHEVRTPFDANSEVWKKHYGVTFDPASHTCEYGDPKLAEMFLMDLEFVLWCDALALLPGAEDSRGARIELLVAKLFNKKLIDPMGNQLSATVTVQVEYDQ